MSDIIIEPKPGYTAASTTADNDNNNKNDNDNNVEMKDDTKNAIIDYASLVDNGVYVIGYGRSAMGCYGGCLSRLSATALGSKVIAGVLQKFQVDAADVDEVLLGNVLQANGGQNPARQASILAGISADVPCTTINKICSSGMKAIAIGCQSIELGHNAMVVCGGMESMSQCPYYLPNHRFGKKMGHDVMVDGMIKDGLWDVYSDQHMGSCAELTAQKLQISREAQDNYAVNSYRKAQHANESGIFADEIIKVEIVNKRKSCTTIIDKDEGCSKLNEKKLRQLPCIFFKEPQQSDDNNNNNSSANTAAVTGSITAGNSSQLSDGAAILVIVSGKYLKTREQQRLQTQSGSQTESQSQSIRTYVPLFKIESYADAAQNPLDFTTSPSIAIPKALARANMTLQEIDMRYDFFEINEAFAVAALSNAQLLNINAAQIESNVNIYGGAVAIGHPLGCSGARICVTLMTVLNRKRGRYGIAGICNGGGGASALILRRL